jgi:hypothetical protein
MPAPTPPLQLTGAETKRKGQIRVHNPALPVTAPGKGHKQGQHKGAHHGPTDRGHAGEAGDGAAQRCPAAALPGHCMVCRCAFFLWGRMLAMLRASGLGPAGVRLQRCPPQAALLHLTRRLLLCLPAAHGKDPHHAGVGARMADWKGGCDGGLLGPSGASLIKVVDVSTGG